MSRGDALSRLRQAALGAVLAPALLAGVGVAAASTSRPGDPLYRFKTAREHLQLSLARPGDSRARLEVKLARTRLGEAMTLLRLDESDRAVATLARGDAALAAAKAHGSPPVDAEADAELRHRVDLLRGLLAHGLPPAAAEATREAITRAVHQGG